MERHPVTTEDWFHQAEEVLGHLDEVPAAPRSTLAVAGELFGAEGRAQLLDEGLPYNEFLLLGAAEFPTVATVEGLLLSEEVGPRPFTLALARDTALPVNILRSGLSLTVTPQYLEVLETLPHRPEPVVQADLLPAEEGDLLAALRPLPAGWRSACGAISLWRDLHAKLLSEPPEGRALAAAVCYVTGPWRLTLLRTATVWREELEVEEESFAAALAFLEEYLRWPGERYRYLPKLPEAGLFEGAEGEEELMDLVKAFLETLEE